MPFWVVCWQSGPGATTSIHIRELFHRIFFPVCFQVGVCPQGGLINYSQGTMKPLFLGGNRARRLHSLWPFLGPLRELPLWGFLCLTSQIPARFVTHARTSASEWSDSFFSPLAAAFQINLYPAPQPICVNPTFHIKSLTPAMFAVARFSRANPRWYSFWYQK